MSCLFRSLTYFNNTDTETTRKLICDYLSDAGPIIDGINTKDLLNIIKRDYILKMRLSSEWGGGIEIQAACNIWGFIINVHNVRNSPPSIIAFTPITPHHKLTECDISWNGVHYQPINK